jgi:cold shock CspA family protein
MNSVRIGRVTRIDAEKGFFFVTEDVTRKSVLCHIKELPSLYSGDRRRVDLSLLVTVNQIVEFEAEETPRGLRATDVRKR